jgi:hypothetical protein
MYHASRFASLARSAAPRAAPVGRCARTRNGQSFAPRATRPTGSPIQWAGVSARKANRAAAPVRAVSAPPDRRWRHPPGWPSGRRATERARQRCQGHAGGRPIRCRGSVGWASSTVVRSTASSLSAGASRLVDESLLLTTEWPSSCRPECSGWSRWLRPSAPTDSASQSQAAVAAELHIAAERSTTRNPGATEAPGGWGDCCPGR